MCDCRGPQTPKKPNRPGHGLGLGENKNAACQERSCVAEHLLFFFNRQCFGSRLKGGCSPFLRVQQCVFFGIS